MKLQANKIDYVAKDTLIDDYIFTLGYYLTVQGDDD